MIYNPIQPTSTSASSFKLLSTVKLSSSETGFTSYGEINIPSAKNGGNIIFLIKGNNDTHISSGNIDTIADYDENSYTSTKFYPGTGSFYIYKRDSKLYFSNNSGWSYQNIEVRFYEVVDDFTFDSTGGGTPGGDSGGTPSGEEKTVTITIYDRSGGNSTTQYNFYEGETWQELANRVDDGYLSVDMNDYVEIYVEDRTYQLLYESDSANVLGSDTIDLSESYMIDMTAF